VFSALLTRHCHQDRKSSKSLISRYLDENHAHSGQFRKSTSPPGASSSTQVGYEPGGSVADSGGVPSIYFFFVSKGLRVCHTATKWDWLDWRAHPCVGVWSFTDFSGLEGSRDFRKKTVSF
jgi:hypothetical protein